MAETSRADYMRDYARANKDRIAAYNRDRRDRRQVVIDELKSVPCADCGGRFPPACMDFDHVGEKTFQIATAYTRSLATVLAEIAKCEVVCANCHRIRTARRLVRKHPTTRTSSAVLRHGACERPTNRYPGGRTGTDAGYQAHLQAGEVPCTPCYQVATATAVQRRRTRLERRRSASASGSLAVPIR